jgi:hypothetical protein
MNREGYQKSDIRYRRSEIRRRDSEDEMVREYKSKRVEEKKDRGVGSSEPTLRKRREGWGTLKYIRALL